MEKNNQSSVDKIITDTMEKLKNMLSANTIVGEVIELNGLYIVPIVKVSVGFATGGGEPKNKRNKGLPNVLGASVSGFNLTPVGFVVIENGVSKYLRAEDNTLNDLFKITNSILEKLTKKDSNENNTH